MFISYMQCDVCELNVHPNTIFLCHACGFYTRSASEMNAHNSRCSVPESEWKKLEDILKLDAPSTLEQRVKSLEASVADILSTMKATIANEEATPPTTSNTVEEIPNPSKKVVKKKVFRSMKKVMEVASEESVTDRTSRVARVVAERNKRRGEVRGEKPTEQEFEDIFEEISRESSSHIKLLQSLVEKRTRLVAYLSPDDYIAKVREHVDRITDLFQKKKYSPRRIHSNIIKVLGPVDAHMVGLPKGSKPNDGYTTIPVELDDFNAYKEALALSIVHPKEFEAFELNKFCENLAHYGIALLPIEEMLSMYFTNPFNCSNIMYVELPKSNPSDPFSFYHLVGIDENTGKRMWELDCRLQCLASRIQTVLYPYTIELFRRIYRDVFGDNRYRKGFADYCPILELEGTQLITNALILFNVRTFSFLIQRLVFQRCIHTITDNDSFNIRTDDVSQRRRMHTDKDDPDMVDGVKELFDGISSEQAVDVYRSYIHK